MGTGIAVAVRLIVPFAIFRWPLAGAVASLVADALDVVIAGAIGRSEFADYAATDKFLDTYYLTFLAFMALKWTDRKARLAAIALYAYRLTGVVLFEATHDRWLLFVFPNLFENFYLFWLILPKIRPSLRIDTLKRYAVIMVFLLALKMPQEYVLHVQQFGPWAWFTAEVLGIE
jgi:hypothetical protein